MTQEITMGSLFSGSGGFELAGSIFGIRPIWASEIEPFPILVTTKMWGNGIALPCAMFVMEGIAMILSEEDADEQK